MSSHEAIRKHDSGAKKRKQAQQKKERQAEILNKTPKLSTFFKSVAYPEDRTEPGTSSLDNDTNLPANANSEIDATLSAADDIGSVVGEASEPDSPTAFDAIGNNIQYLWVMVTQIGLTQ